MLGDAQPTGLAGARVTRLHIEFALTARAGVGTEVRSPHRGIGHDGPIATDANATTALADYLKCLFARAVAARCR